MTGLVKLLMFVFLLLLLLIHSDRFWVVSSSWLYLGKRKSSNDLFFLFRIISRAKQFVILLGAGGNGKRVWMTGLDVQLIERKSADALLMINQTEIIVCASPHLFSDLRPLWRPQRPRLHDLQPQAQAGQWVLQHQNEDIVRHIVFSRTTKTEKNRKKIIIFLPDSTSYKKALPLPVCKSDIATFAETRTLCAPKYIGVFFVSSV